MKKVLIISIFVLHFLIPFNTYALESNDELIKNATSGVLMEANSGKILFEKEKDKKVSIASMTKMVAQIIILENIEKGTIKWTDKVTVSKNAADMGGSQIYISEGEKISIRDLMKGISMASGNDATVAMAEVISGSEDKFVELMNKKVKELGLKNTQFKNCTGLDEEGHFSTAYDMAIIARELVVKHPEILKFSSVYEEYLREDTDNKFWLVNTNKLVRYYEGADGLKTGHTDNAKYCLAATAKRKDMRLIAIVLGEDNSKKRNNETMALLDYGFNSINYNKLKEKGEVIKKISLDKANKKTVELVLEDELGVVEEKNANKHKYKYDIVIDNIKLPIKKNSVVGKIIVKENDKEVSRANLIVEEEIKDVNYFDLFINSIKEISSGLY
ncbi:MAG: D-alanyl-D-alanine carboxypeptidase [Bacilli bacterium]|nr:D-alanyl-D-alanine carboxypeptidase [Bacilli bacterium]